MNCRPGLALVLDRAGELPVSGTITRLAVADLDRDGHLDIAAASDSGKLAIFGGRGDGTFVDRQRIELTAPAAGVAIGDLDADGWADVVVAASPAQLLFFPGSAGSLGAPSGHPLAGDLNSRLVSVAVRDVDRDGRAELLVEDGARVAVYGRNEGGGLELAESYTWDEFGLKDVAGDAQAERLTTASATGLLLRLTDGSVSEAPISLGHLVVSDLDNDGDRDVATASGFVIVHLNQGGGMFKHLERDPEPLVTRAFYETEVAVADLDCDGHQDLALATTSNPGLLMGTGDGWFALGLDLPEARWSIKLGDFDEDGFPDVAAADHEPSAVHILLNRAR